MSVVSSVQKTRVDSEQTELVQAFPHVLARWRQLQPSITLRKFEALRRLFEGSRSKGVRGGRAKRKKRASG